MVQISHACRPTIRCFAPRLESFISLPTGRGGRKRGLGMPQLLVCMCRYFRSSRLTNPARHRHRLLFIQRSLLHKWRDYDLVRGCLSAAGWALSLHRGLSLNNNELSGTLPESIGNLTSLTILYVSLREEVDSLDAEPSFCRRSLILNARLSGSIPASIGRLTNLQSLCVALLEPCACWALSPCAQSLVQQSAQRPHPRVHRQFNASSATVRAASIHRVFVWL